MLWVAIFLAAAGPANKAKAHGKQRDALIELLGGDVGERRAPAPEQFLQQLIDEESREIVRAAPHVEVLRLRSDPDGYGTVSARADEAHVGGFAVAYRRVLEDPQLVADVRQVVLAPASYRGKGGGKLCGGFLPKLVFRFQSAEKGKKRFVDVLVCFNCMDVGVIPAKHAGSKLVPMLADIDGTSVWSDLAQRVLPDDPKVNPRGH